MRALDGRMVDGRPTPNWAVLAATTPVWGRDANPDVNPYQVRQVRGGSALSQPRPMTAGPPSAREIARTDPLRHFFLQRPLAKKACRDAIPTARRRVEPALQAEVDAALKKETTRINRFLAEQGLSPRSAAPAACAVGATPEREWKQLKRWNTQLELNVPAGQEPQPEDEADPRPAERDAVPRTATPADAGHLSLIHI